LLDRVLAHHEASVYAEHKEKTQTHPHPMWDQTLDPNVQAVKDSNALTVHSL